MRDVVAQPPVRLTRAQLETLALVAYRQPITRPEIDDVRGVDSGSALRVLLERGLLKMLGRKDEPGRPLLYGTAPHFLEFFGMRSLKDLPTLREFTELSDENRALFQRKTGETIEEAEAALLAAEEAEPQDAPAVQDEDEDAPASSANDAGEGTEEPAPEYSSIEETATEEIETAADPAATQDVEEADADSSLQAAPLQDDDDDVAVDAETHAGTHADADEDRAEADITTRVER